MTAMAGIAARRLRAQRLTGEPFTSAVDAVRWLGAVQAQDHIGARWALGMRVGGATEDDLDRLFDDGAILRTHVLRPTWHFVLPEDIGWLLRLTGPRVRAGLAGRWRRLEIDEQAVGRAGAAFVAALGGGRHRTRRELGEVLSRVGISPEGQRLPHFLLTAELDGIIVSGPRRGKEHTYALMAERAPAAVGMERGEAIAELALRYFRSHGPAQVQDFVWWSGLTVADTRRAIALVRPALERQVVEGKEYWFDPGAAPGPRKTEAPAAHLLPNFDEYTVAYRDRSAILHQDVPVDPTLFAFGSILSNVLTIGGQVRGGWRRRVGRGAMTAEIRLLAPLTAAETAAVAAAVQRLGAYLQHPVDTAFAPSPGSA
ncbi:MAG TPA: winged helix DNA-binding domain-containing protein [Candidatus Dormibacteraeota bacterium]|jgi:hypothetical protein|nr:winged helix DNA-binding domain-containing protein [Candidatus Dormibacteraeota bacterium]